MTILNRDQLHGIRRNILGSGLCEMAKCRGFTSKPCRVMLGTSTGVLGQRLKTNVRWRMLRQAPFPHWSRWDTSFPCQEQRFFLAEMIPDKWHINTSCTVLVDWIDRLSLWALDVWECTAEITHLSTHTGHLRNLGLRQKIQKEKKRMKSLQQLQKQLAPWIFW